MMATLDVAAIGAAVVDVVAACDEAFLARQRLTKGEMTRIGFERAAALEGTVESAIRRPGGSVANTAGGVAALGGRAVFIGSVGADELGESFVQDTRRLGVDCRVRTVAAPARTGRCFVFVTPDGERTLATCLGVAGRILITGREVESIATAAFTLIEGYLLGDPAADAALGLAVHACRSAGRQVALSLSDPGWIRRHRDAYTSFLENVDLVLANVAEASALTGSEDEDHATLSLQHLCERVVITRGGRGSTVIVGGSRWDIPAVAVPQVLDSTGAGDIYSAGFIYGLCSNLGPAGAGMLGSLAAADVISQRGPRHRTSLEPLVARVAAEQAHSCARGKAGLDITCRS